MSCECGHSFCYDCVNSWFENKLNCPTCRTDIENKPILNLQLKDIGRNIVELLVETSTNEDEKRRLIKHRDRSIKIYEDDRENNQLFGDLFDGAVTLIDTSDGVPRCGNCHWEARGEVCNHCGHRLRSNIDENDEDEEAAYDEDDDEVEAITLDGPNEYDTDDSFIDPRNDVEIFGEQESFSGGSDQSLDWTGFEDEPEEQIYDDNGYDDGNFSHEIDLSQALDRFHRQDRRRHEVIDLSEGSEDENTNVNRHPRRVINVSDDEDNW